MDRGLTPVWAPLQRGPAQESRRGTAWAYWPDTWLVPPRAATSASASPLKKLAVPASLDVSGDWLQLEPSRKEGPARSQKEEEKGPPQGRPGESRHTAFLPGVAAGGGCFGERAPWGFGGCRGARGAQNGGRQASSASRLKHTQRWLGSVYLRWGWGSGGSGLGPRPFPRVGTAGWDIGPAFLLEPVPPWQRWGVCSQHLMGRTAGVLAGCPCCRPGGGQGPGGHGVSQDVSASSHPLGTSRGCWAWQAYQDARASWGAELGGPPQTTSGSRWAWFLPLPQGGPQAQPV